MEQSLTFTCSYCDKSVVMENGASTLSHCPECSEPITNEQSTTNFSTVLKQYPKLKNISEKEYKLCSKFMNAYYEQHTPIIPNDNLKPFIITEIVRKQLLSSIVKRYETLEFSNTMEGGKKDLKKFNSELIGRKDFNKAINKVLKESGVKVKKTGLLGIFG
jgi:hypothetical protein